jgi:hypothetical protein
VDVEVPKLDSDGNEISGEFVSAQELKVGKMENAILGTAALLDVSKDLDRFRVRIGGIGSSGHDISIKLSTEENPDAGYNDDATDIEIDLVVDGDDLVSVPMLLVADDEDDDDIANESDLDDDKNDQTHKIQLGGKVKISQLIIGEQEYPINIERSVSVRKTVDLEVLIVRAHEVTLDSNGNEQVSLTTPIEEAEFRVHMKLAQERYSQVGVQLNYTITVIDPPDYEPGVFDLTDGLDSLLPDDPETLKFFDEKASESNSDLQMFVFNYLGGPDGQLQGRSYWTAEHDGKPYKNAVIINANWLDQPVYQVPAHEIGHSLGLEHYAPSGTSLDSIVRNVMTPAVYTDRGPGFDSPRKRITKEQEGVIHSSVLAH